MESNSSSAAKVQVAQAVNVLAKQEIVDLSSKQGIASMTNTEAELVEIQQEQSSSSSFWGDFLKIVVPIVMTVIAIVVIALTLGTATPAAALGDAAVTTLVDTSLEATETGGEALEMTDMAATSEGVTGTTGTTTGATGTATSTTGTTATGVTQEASTSAWQTARTVLTRVATYEAIPAAFEGTIPDIESVESEKYAGEASDAGAEEQAAVVIQSAAVTNLESNIQEDMSVSQNEQSVQQSGLSLAEQAATTMTKIYSLG